MLALVSSSASSWLNFLMMAKPVLSVVNGKKCYSMVFTYNGINLNVSE